MSIIRIHVASLLRTISVARHQETLDEAIDLMRGLSITDDERAQVVAAAAKRTVELEQHA